MNNMSEREDKHYFLLMIDSSANRAFLRKHGRPVDLVIEADELERRTIAAAAISKRVRAVAFAQKR